MGAGGRERPGRYRVGGRRRRAGATSGASSGAQRSGARRATHAGSERSLLRLRRGGVARTGRPVRASRCVPRPIRTACGGGRTRARQQGGGSNGTRQENVRTRRARRNLPILWTARAARPPSPESDASRWDPARSASAVRQWPVPARPCSRGGGIARAFGDLEITVKKLLVSWSR